VTALERVRGAAAATLAQPSARLRQKRFADPPAPRALGFFDQTCEGVADLVLRRTLTTILDSPGADELARRLEERWPWLDDGTEEDDPDEPTQFLHAGLAGWMKSAGRWGMLEPGDPAAGRRRTPDPLWIVEALAVADEAWEHDDRFGFRFDPAAHAGEVELSRERPGQMERRAGEVWVDDTGLIGRVTWTHLPRGRPRLRRIDPGSARLWTTLELSDFGTPVDIPLPDVPEPPASPPWPAELADLAWSLWRKRRDYRAQQR
jgi:hypothetical protein